MKKVRARLGPRSRVLRTKLEAAGTAYPTAGPGPGYAGPAQSPLAEARSGSGSP